MKFVVDESELKLGKENYCLYFYASWLPYHKKMMVMLEKMEAEFPHFAFYAIDVDEFKSAAPRFKVQEVPTCILYINGKEKARIKGMCMTSACRAAFIAASKSVYLKKEEEVSNE